MSRNPIFCAIDTTDIAAAVSLAERIAENVGGLKLGLEFFTANGPKGVREVQAALGKDIFLDLKLHDIPNTVAAAVKAVMRLRPRYLTLHTAGGSAMLKAARRAVCEAADGDRTAPPKLIGVTVLTSFDQADLAATGVPGSVSAQAHRLAALAAEAGLDGLVCSAHEAKSLKTEFGSLLRIVPGIRPDWAAAGDQKRVMTPAEALREGADILVIGRPITQAKDPADAARRIAAEIADALPPPRSDPS
jgi:orotidine-5'-phosphate decarboxylase